MPLCMQNIHVMYVLLDGDDAQIFSKDANLMTISLLCELLVLISLNHGIVITCLECSTICSKVGKKQMFQRVGSLSKQITR
jgi:hypothetical protein